MPLRFPNEWGVKKPAWPPTYKPKETEEDLEDSGEVINSHGEMKCPECDNWVSYFNYTGSSTEYGTVNSEGDIDANDSDFNGVDSITCPHCEREVFGSSTRRLKEYYNE